MSQSYDRPDPAAVAGEPDGPGGPGGADGGAGVPRTTPIPQARPAAPHASAPSSAEAGPPPPPRRHGIRAALRETLIVVGMALLLSLIVKTWLLQAFYIPSASMEDTLVQGDRVIVSKLTPGPFALERGDIVVFEDPGDWLQGTVPPERSPVGNVVAKTLTFVGLLPSDEGNHLIKRVIGLPGDRVSCCDSQGRLTVNGTPIVEPYVKPGDEPSSLTFDVTVPAGKVWVMGDHRADSSDSRYHPLGGDGTEGSVPIDNIVGRAVAVVWPLRDITWLGQPSATFSDVPSAKPSPATGGTPTTTTTGTGQ